MRRISISAVRASEKVQLSRLGSRLRAFQRAIDEVRTLPLTLQRVAQKANLSFKNKCLYISVTDEASDFKFGMLLGFVKVHHQMPLEEKWVWPWARGAPQISGSPIIFLQWLWLATLNLVRSRSLPRPTIKPHSEEKWARP